MKKRDQRSYQDMHKDELIALLESKDETLIRVHREVMDFCDAKHNPTMMISGISHQIKHDINDFVTRYDYEPNAL